MKRAYASRGRGFTIVELLIVIVVIAILAALTYVGYSGFNAKARDSRRVDDVQAITKALELYYVDNGKYPTGAGSSSINSSWSTSNEEASWDHLMDQLAPYIDSLPVDPVNVGTDSRYSYFSNTSNLVPGYCGVNGRGQMYVLGYALESGKISRVTVGDCSTDPVATARSYYRVAK